MDQTSVLVLVLIFAGALLLILVAARRQRASGKVTVSCDARGCTHRLKVDPKIFHDLEAVLTNPAITRAQWTAAPASLANGQRIGTRVYCPFHSGGQS